ncbi:MAG TPA: hypothetical protein VF411_01415, partial [Bacteroidia bacterium]
FYLWPKTFFKRAIMTNVAFRKTKPQRTCQKTYTRYQPFKPYLKEDFNSRCGYTDCADKWFGGITTFHIDHFAPLKGFPALKTTYGNLVYSCSYVNILKSDDDPANYLDPCNDEYNDHFYRDKLGAIYPNSNSPKAQYMHRRLKLGLARYQVIWLLDNLYDCMKGLQSLVDTLPNGSDEDIAFRKLHFELTKEFTKYFDYLNKS